jgi:hypothetical protein
VTWGTTWLARLAGLEPATGCLEGSCSIQLSYRRPEHIVHDLGHMPETSSVRACRYGRPALRNISRQLCLFLDGYVSKLHRIETHHLRPVEEVLTC